LVAVVQVESRPTLVVLVAAVQAQWSYIQISQSVEQSQWLLVQVQQHKTITTKVVQVLHQVLHRSLPLVVAVVAIGVTAVVNQPTRNAQKFSVQTVVQAEAAVLDFRTLWVVLLHHKLFHRVLRHTEIVAVTQ
jgi:hypothetical protein